jgi:hypothetical protein
MKHQTVGNYIIPTYSIPDQTGSEYFIPTYSPSELGASFGYHVTMTPLSEVVQFNVRCITENVSKAVDAYVNAHLLAYYMETGDLPYPKLIKR